MLLQTLIVRALRFVLSIYYAAIHVRGAPVPAGPVILVANHPNMLLDPLLVASFSERVRFSIWAKSTLFKGFMGTLFRALGAVPVYRRQDFPPGTSLDNATLFAHSVDALEAGNALLLFPEGISHSQPTLQPLKTGMARVAQAYYERTGRHVPVVPVGLNYVGKHKFASHVQISYGAPLVLDDALAHDKRTQVHELTERAQASLFALTVNAEDFPTLLDIRVAREIYVDGRSLPLRAHVGIAQRMASFYAEHRDDEGVAPLRASIRAYRERLEALGLHDWQVSPRFAAGGVLASTLVRNAAFALATLPFALVSFLLHLPAYLLGRFINRNTKYVEEKAQGKLLVLFVFVPLWYALLLGVLFFCTSTPTFVVCAVVLPLVGMIQVQVVQAERHSFHSLLDLLWLSLLLRNSTRGVAELAQQRAALQAEIQQLALRYLKSTGQSSLLEGHEAREDTHHQYAE